MKKRVKLITTIASLCLAVALMAFGVYAATNSNFGVTSKVSYTVSGEVHVQFDVAVAFTSNVNRTEGTTEDQLTIDATSAKLTNAIVQKPGEGNVQGSIDLGVYAFQPGVTTSDYVEYTIKIKNLGKYDANVVVTGLLKNDNTKSVTITRTLTNVELTDGTGNESGTIAKETEATFVVKFAMADVTTDYAETTFNPTFVVSAK